MSDERKAFVEKQKQAFTGWMKGSMFMPNDGFCYKCHFDLIKHELDKGNDGSQGVTGCHQCLTSYCE